MNRFLQNTFPLQKLKTLYQTNRYMFWLLFLFWFTLAFTTSNKDLIYYSLFQDEYEIAAWVLFLRGFLLWTLAACFIPLIVVLARRFPIDGEKTRWTNVVLHVVFSILFLFLLALSFNLIFRQLLWEGNSFTETLLWILYWYNLGIPVAYWLIIGGLLLNKNITLYNSRRQKSVALQSELKKIQLRVLQLQLRPHFLFNALNSVTSLIHEDRDAAQQVLGKIKHYLDISIRETNRNEITLAEELKFSRLYMDIEKERYSDRLEIEMDIEPDLLKALVPNMILQPVVENAVRHGIAPNKEKGKLVVRAKKENDRLTLQVEDSGKGLKNVEILKNNGIGLKNTMGRLDKLYNGDYNFTIDESALGGCKVIITLPLVYGHQSARISKQKELNLT